MVTIDNFTKHTPHPQLRHLLVKNYPLRTGRVTPRLTQSWGGSSRVEALDVGSVWRCAWPSDLMGRICARTFLVLNLLTITLEATLFSMSRQPAMMKSPVQPPQEFRAYPMNIPETISVPNWLKTTFAFRWDYKKKHFCPKWYNWRPSNGAPTLLSCGEFLSASLSCVLRKKTEAFHRFSPPIFWKTRLNQKSRSPFLYSTDCSFGKSVGFWSVWCWLVVISRQVFTSTNKYGRGLSVWIIPGFWPGNKNFHKHFILIENFLICRCRITFFAVEEYGLLVLPGGSCTELG